MRERHLVRVVVEEAVELHADAVEVVVEGGSFLWLTRREVRGVRGWGGRGGGWRDGMGMGWGGLPKLEMEMAWRRGAVQGIEGRRRIRTSPADWMREEASLDIPLEDMGGVGQQTSNFGVDVGVLEWPVAVRTFG